LFLQGKDEHRFELENGFKFEFICVSHRLPTNPVGQ
jgi:hypothetical protein